MAKTLILGERNTTAIAAGAQGLPIEITYNYGGNFRITSFQIYYAVNIDFALVTLKDTQNNRDLISGNTILASVAAPIAPGLARFMPWMTIEPIEIANGQTVQMFLNNITATALAANQLGLTLFGTMG